MAKRRVQKLTLEAFLEAIEDASGYEDDVLRHFGQIESCLARHQGIR